MKPDNSVVEAEVVEGVEVEQVLVVDCNNFADIVERIVEDRLVHTASEPYS